MSTFPLLQRCVALTERYINLLPRDNAKKDLIKDQVYDMLVKSYADQGGIAGSGFRSPDDMVENIPFWKISRKNGAINAVGMYKDTLGRKRVAVATDGTPEGKAAAAEMTKSELQQGRAYSEVSGRALSFARKQIDIKPYLIPFDEAVAILARRGDNAVRPPADDPEIIRHPDLKDYFYSRVIGGQPHTKVMVGKQGIPLY